MRCPTLTELPPPPPGRTGWPWTEESPQLPDTMPDGSPWPRVSIVTPSYNQARFIEETIRSVLLQGYPDLEYIIVDGGSTDGSVEIIRKYEPWLAYWVSEKDAGQADAINKGWQRSSGEILAWLNSDDTYEPAAIGTAVSLLECYPDVAMIAGDCRVIDASGNVIRRLPAGEYNLINQLFSNAIPQPGTFVRRPIAEAIGYLDGSMHYVFDADFWMRLSLAGAKIVRWSSLFANYRYWSNSKSVSVPVRFDLEKIRLLDKLYSTPDLSSEIVLARPLAYGCLYLRIGLGYQMSGDWQTARSYVERAIKEYPKVCDSLVRCSSLAEVVSAAENAAGTARQFVALLEDVAQSNGLVLNSDKVYSNLMSVVRTVAAWNAYQRDDLAGVRKSLWQVARHRPAALLLNRGLISIGLEALVGPNLMKRLRMITHGQFRVWRGQDHRR